METKLNESQIECLELIPNLKKQLKDATIVNNHLIIPDIRNFKLAVKESNLNKIDFGYDLEIDALQWLPTDESSLEEFNLSVDVAEDNEDYNDARLTALNEHWSGIKNALINVFDEYSDSYSDDMQEFYKMKNLYQKYKLADDGEAVEVKNRIIIRDDGKETYKSGTVTALVATNKCLINIDGHTGEIEVNYGELSLIPTNKLP